MQSKRQPQLSQSSRPTIPKNKQRTAHTQNIVFEARLEMDHRGIEYCYVARRYHQADRIMATLEIAFESNETLAADNINALTSKYT